MRFERRGVGVSPPPAPRSGAAARSCRQDARAHRRVVPDGDVEHLVDADLVIGADRGAARGSRLSRRRGRALDDGLSRGKPGEGQREDSEQLCTIMMTSSPFLILKRAAAISWAFTLRRGKRSRRRRHDPLLSTIRAAPRTNKSPNPRLRIRKIPDNTINSFIGSRSGSVTNA
jgi:hypothetical protein